MMSSTETARTRLYRWYASGTQGDKWHGREMREFVDSTRGVRLFGSTLKKHCGIWWCDHVRVPDELQADVDTWLAELQEALQEANPPHKT